MIILDFRKLNDGYLLIMPNAANEERLSGRLFYSLCSPERSEGNKVNAPHSPH
jgi:hypothetical protein